MLGLQACTTMSGYFCMSSGRETHVFLLSRQKTFPTELSPYMLNADFLDVFSLPWKGIQSLIIYVRPLSHTVRGPGK